MKWKAERDLLVAQTMAFVQSVTGKKPEVDSRVELSFPVDGFQQLEPRVETPSGETSPGETSLVETAVTPRKSPATRSAIREEIEGRVAAFRAHQQRFDRERDRHFNSVLTGIRAAITDPPKASPP